MTAPFFASPGLDPDTWRVLLAAQHIAEHHSYVASRLPGYPVPELVFSLLANGPAWVSVGLTCLVSLAGFFSYSRILEEFGLGKRALTTLAFALLPVVLINCLTTMDYLWAVSFALFSFLLITRKQFLVAGISLGLAVGCRITTILIFVPFCYFIWSSSEGQRMRIKESTLFFLSTLIVSIACFGPVISAYGLSFLHHAPVGPMHLVNLVKTVTVDVVGLVGAIAILGSVVVQLASKRQRIRTEPISGALRTTSWLVVALFGLLFLWMPLDAGYLIPLVPFALILTRYYLTPAAFKTLAFGLILSSFIVSVDTKDRPWSAPSSPVSFRANLAGRGISVDFVYGPLTLDLLKRSSQLAYGDSVVAWARAQNDTAVLVAGVWLPQLTYLTRNGMGRSGEEGFRLGNVSVVGLLNAERAAAFRRSGQRILYLPGQDRYANDVYGVKLMDFGGRELDLHRSAL